jgi:hypothetical protein
LAAAAAARGLLDRLAAPRVLGQALGPLQRLALLRRRVVRVERGGEGEEGLPQAEQRRHLPPRFPALAQQHDLVAARNADRIADRAGGHALQHARDRLLHLLLPHPAEVAALQGALGLAELGGGQGEGDAAAELADHLLDEAPRLALAAGVVDGDEDLGGEVLGLPDPRLGAADRLLHLGLGGLGLGAELQAQQPRPADLGADLVVEHARLHADARELGAQGAGGQVVALLELAHRVGHVRVGDGDAPPLDLLHAQALVDDEPGDLRDQPLQHLRRDGDAGVEGEEAGAADDVGAADGLPVHHGDDAVALRHGGGGLGLRLRGQLGRRGEGAERRGGGRRGGEHQGGGGQGPRTVAGHGWQD